MTHHDFVTKMQELYGDPGVFAAESTCLTPDDISQGFDHCLTKCLPALEEEMLAEQRILEDPE